MADRGRQAEQTAAAPTESDPLRRLLRLVAREVVRRLRVEQTQPKEPATDGSQG